MSMERDANGVINWIGVDVDDFDIETLSDAYFMLEALHRMAVTFKEQKGIVGYPILLARDLGD